MPLNRAEFLLTLIASQTLFGQNGGTLVGVGYERPPQFTVAPGQIVKLRVAGLAPLSSTGTFRQDATTLPLPNTLAGISVSVSQEFIETKTTFAAPLFSIEQRSLCILGTPLSAILLPDCYLTILTVQIPTELVPTKIGPLQGPDALGTQIVIAQDGKPSFGFLLFVAQGNVHVVTACDSDPLASACTPVVTHGDGTPVSKDSPAQAGETIVVYAWGLGQTTPSVKTGEPTPTAAPIVFNPYHYIEFDFHPNASPSSTPTTFPYQFPVFAGLTPGQVGLYQMNIQLPDTFPPIGSCGGNILSNLTINIGGTNSIDGAPICVNSNL
jgi:hypothetical protein